MLELQRSLKRVVPGHLWTMLHMIRRYPTWPFAPAGRHSIERLRAIKDRHRGERCVILGNGPSLRDTDVARLRDEVTIGLNRVYLGFPNFGFSTTYLVAVNPLVLTQSGAEIARCTSEKFISWVGRKHVPPAADVTYLKTLRLEPFFQTDLTGELWEGGTVTFVAMQLAYYMGFDEVVLIGVDHSFQTSGRPNQEVRLTRNDGDHFVPDYFPPGFVWNLPDLDKSELAYKLARKVFESDRRNIFDATRAGRLNVFPKVEFEEFFPRLTHPECDPAPIDGAEAHSKNERLTTIK